MRKDSIIGLLAILTILTVGVSIEAIFNVIVSFFISGVVPGTGLVLPSSLMFAVAVIALSVLIVRSLRRYLPESKPLNIDSFKSNPSV